MFRYLIGLLRHLLPMLDLRSGFRFEVVDAVLLRAAIGLLLPRTVRGRLCIPFTTALNLRAVSILRSYPMSAVTHLAGSSCPGFMILALIVLLWRNRIP